MALTSQQSMDVSHLEDEMKECAPDQGGADWNDHVKDWVVAAGVEHTWEIRKEERRQDEDRRFIQFQTIFTK